MQGVALQSFHCGAPHSPTHWVARRMLEARAVLMESLQKRYVARFSAQIVSGLILLLSQSLMLRGLGPKEYGDYTFTTQFFTQLTAFLDFGVTVAFFTKLSQRPDDLGLIRFYYSYWVVLGLIQLLFLLVAFGWPLSSVLWPGQSFASVLFGLFWALSNNLWQGTSRIADAYALTTRSEKVKVVMRVGALLVLLPFFLTKSLTLPVVLGSQILSYAILTFVLYRIARPDGGISWNFQLKTFFTYGREVFEFCIPLFWYGLMSLIAGTFDNWMLQRFGGSVQQGYFGLSTQLNFICLLFGTAMMPLIHRELAVASARGSGMRELYLKCVFPVVTGAAFFAVFIAVNAREIVLFFSGSAYLPAVTAVTLGVLYTIPQSFSQLSGTLFFATGRTSVFGQLGMIGGALGLPLTFLLVAPSQVGGLGLGAIGLAAKMLLVALVLMVIQLRLCALQLQISVWSELRRYFVVGIALSVMAKCSQLFSEAVFSSGILRLIMSAGLFAGFLLVMALLASEKLGLPRDWIERVKLALPFRKSFY